MGMPAGVLRELRRFMFGGVTVQMFRLIGGSNLNGVRSHLLHRGGQRSRRMAMRPRPGQSIGQGAEEQKHHGESLQQAMHGPINDDSTPGRSRGERQLFSPQYPWRVVTLPPGARDRVAGSVNQQEFVRAKPLKIVVAAPSP